MTKIVALIGVLIVLIGLVGFVQPARFRSLIMTTESQARFVFAIVIRLALGVLLWWLADELRHPHVMRILAVISVVAAFAVLIMGRERLDKLINWWLSRPDGLLRVSTMLAAVFGAYLTWVAI